MINTDQPEEKEKIKKPKIFNLSCKVLTKQQQSILMKGLKFTPTPQKNLVDLKNDINILIHKLRLIEHFENTDKNSKNSSNSKKTIKQSENNDHETKSLIKEKSEYCPPKSKDKVFLSQIDQLSKLNLENITSNTHQNLSKAEWFALKDLINDKSIVIKKADKGGAVVIMNAKHYEKMAYDQLNDSKTYKKLDFSNDFNIMRKLTKFVNEYKNSFTNDELKCLTNSKFTTSQFYGLPKLHKSKILKAEIEKQNSEIINFENPEDLKLRPIISGTKCPTRNLSDILDKILKPLLVHVKSYTIFNVAFF